MPRHYKRKTEKNNWTEDQLRVALDAIRVDQKKIRAFSRQFNIPESTLRNRLKANSNKHGALGRKTTFTDAEEKELADHILCLAQLYYGVTPKELRKVAFEFAEAKNIRYTFNKNKKLAGKDWLSLFVKRNPQISLRQPEGTSLNRIGAFNAESVNRFFSNLKVVMEKNTFLENRIFNIGETGITTVQKKCLKVYGPKGVKRVGAATSGEKGRTVTAVFCVSAAGNYLPPMLIYPRVRMNPQLTKNGPIGAIYGCSKNGWTNESLYLDWLRHFKNHVKPTEADPVLLILDNHSSHITLEAFEFCKSNFISVVSLSPHTSHRVQPLDLTFFGPLKNALYREFDLYLTMTAHEKITEYDLAELLNKAFIKVATIEKAVSGFRSAGIWPFNPDKFTEHDFAPANALREVVVEQACLETPNAASSSNDSVGPADPQTPEALEPLNNIVGAPGTPQPGTSKSISPKIVKVQDISPVPVKKPTAGDKKKQRQTRKKQQSEILTATPQKKKLEDAKEKKRLTQELKRRRLRKKKTIKPGVKRCLIPKAKQNKNFEETSDETDESDVCMRELCDDDELNDTDDANPNELCTICGEFGRNNELWYQCTKCS